MCHMFLPGGHVIILVLNNEKEPSCVTPRFDEPMLHPNKCWSVDFWFMHRS